MANVRDSDTSLWLHNKLGTSNDSWTGGSICSQLNPEVLRNVKECFPDLQTQVKLKLLLSFFQIPHRSVQEWKTELEEILEVAQVDSDRWVSVLAEIFRGFPSNHSISAEHLEVKENKRIFDDLVHDLRKQLKKHTDLNMLPLECHYLNKSALVNLIGQIPVPKKHFTLKRKPKSAAVKADLIQKSADLSSNMKKNVAPAVPVRSRGMPRKMTDTTPLKGIPSRSPYAGFRTSVLTSNVSRPAPTRPLSGRKDCAIKLLDINEQPIGFAQARKRKRIEMEESKRSLDDFHNLSSTENNETNSATSSVLTSATPEYAAGLTSLNPPTPAANFPVEKSPAQTPSIPAPTVATSYLSPFFQAQNPVQASSRTSQTLDIADSTAIRDDGPNSKNILGTIQKTSQKCPVIKTTKEPIKSQTFSLGIPSNEPLDLPPETLKEAEQMFKNANSVTEPEKLHILGFMAGSRENPFPTVGNAMTIKLSENKVDIQQPDGSIRPMNVEMHFQMDYNTGKWNWIETRRDIDTSTLSSLAAVAVATANDEQFNSKPRQQVA